MLLRERIILEYDRGPKRLDFEGEFVRVAAARVLAEDCAILSGTAFQIERRI